MINSRASPGASSNPIINLLFSIILQPRKQQHKGARNELKAQHNQYYTPIDTLQPPPIPQPTKETMSTEPNPSAQRPGASPSPPPPAPVPLTPGPRASKLQEIFDKALARTLRANSYANFSGCFPTPAKHVPASLESVWRQLNAKLEESAKAEFEDILAERDAVRQLNELDRLVGEAKVRKDRGVGGDSVAYVPPSLFLLLLFGSITLKACG